MRLSPFTPFTQRLHDKSEIRRRLNLDREWSLYALADLDDGMFEQSNWWSEGDGLALVFRGIEICPIFVLGDAASTHSLLASLPQASGYLNLKPHQVDAAAGIYRFRERHQMQRMFLEDAKPRAGRVETLTSAHRNEIERLYATGDGGGIAFAAFQLDTGFFRGIRRKGELVAVAGVHVISRNESVAGLGNIFTRADCRGQGLAQTVTSAVAMALKEAGIETIGLNVEHTNSAAIRAYERIGFRAHFSYYEGLADRVSGVHPSTLPDGT